jgi:DNA-binding SARP family transcriptional activator
MEEKQTMDEKTYKTVLSSIMERVSRLENEVRELRQILLVQVSRREQPIVRTSSSLADADLPELVVTGTGCWQVTCLGIFHLRCAGRYIASCRSQRGQSILKYLLASPGYTASAEALMECFWPHVDPAASKRNLQVAVHALRNSLHGCGPNGDDETVLFRNNCYLLNPALSIVQDVDIFRAAYQRGQRAAAAGSSREAIQAFEEARTCYTGDFLADSCEEWTSGHRLALQDIRLSLLSQLGFLYSQGKEWEAATSCYHEILAVDCYREDIYRQLMRCYAACGRMADVKRTYRTCQKRLRCDLRLAPAPETTALYQQLAQHHALLDQN